MNTVAPIVILDRSGGHSAPLVALLEALGRVVTVMHPLTPQACLDALSNAIIFIFEDILEVWSDEEALDYFQKAAQCSTAIVLLCHDSSIVHIQKQITFACDIMLFPLHPGLLRAKLDHLDACFKHAAPLGATIVREKNGLQDASHDKEIAVHLYKDKIERSLGSLPGIRVYQNEEALLRGELILADRNPIGDLHVLVTQFSVKGLSAVIGGLSVCDIFYSMVNKNFSAAIILAELNKKLQRLLPQGVTVNMAYLCQLQRGGVLYWNAGLPPLILLKGQEPAVLLASDHPALGELPEEEFLPQMRISEFLEQDRIVVAMHALTPAVIEQMRLGVSLNALDPLLALRPDETCVCLKGDSSIFIEKEHQVVNQALKQDWTLSMRLGPYSLKSFDPLPFLSNLLIEIPQLNPHRTSLHTILTELYSNGLEHGLLRLDSSMKESPEGIERYYNERQKRLYALKEGSMALKLQLIPKGEGGEIWVEIEDSGPGFDASRFQDPSDLQDAYSGRGLALVFGLCHSVRYSEKGNSVTICYQW